MLPFTYTTKYEACSKDSFKNNCEYDCCLTYSGGNTATLQICSQALEEDAECTDSFIPIESTADTCATDGAGNTCSGQCCMTIGAQVSCVVQAYCNGYNLDAYTRENIINYGNSLGVSITPSKNAQNSASAIGGIVTFGMACFILLVVIFVTVYSISKVRKQNQTISYHVQRQAEAESGKNIFYPGKQVKQKF